MNPPRMSAIVCHVLLCETADGLVLVDAGLGRADFADPTRMGPARFITRPARNDAETAAAQLEAHGHALSDVAHIVLTHMDFDHIGGAADFPDAVVHTTADEFDWAVTNPDFMSRRRYSQKQWAYGPRFEQHAGPGDTWRFGLTGIEVLPGITYVPMPGHTKGHAAVAVEPAGGGVLFHAGDAVFDASSYASSSPSGRPLDKIGKLRGFEKVAAQDGKKLAGNHETLSRLNAEDGVTVFNAHDKRIFDDLAG